VVNPGPGQAGQPSQDIHESEDAGGFTLISLPGLVRMKLSSFRDKDRMHLCDLIETGLVDENWCATLPAALAARRRELLENPE
jgi:hypothetical protein